VAIDRRKFWLALQPNIQPNHPTYEYSAEWHMPMLNQVQESPQNRNRTEAGGAARRNLRTTLENLAYIHMEPDSGAIVLNVSEGGLGFHAVGPVLQTGTIRLWFSLKPNERVEAAGELAWTDASRKTGGLRFTYLSEGAQEQVRKWIGQDARFTTSVDTTGSAVAASPTAESSMAASFAAPTPGAPSMAAAPVVASVTAPGAEGPASTSISPDTVPSGAREVSARSFFDLTASRMGPAPRTESAAKSFLHWEAPIPVTPTPDSSPRFAHGFVTGVLVSALLAAVPLGFVYRQQARDLWSTLARKAATKPEQQSESFPPPPPPIANFPAGVSSPAQKPEPPATLPPDSAVQPPDRREGVDPGTKPDGGVLAKPFTGQSSSLPHNVAESTESSPAGTPPDDSQTDLVAAQRYLQGPSGSKNVTAAVGFLWAAVEKGNSTAEVMLADLYSRGEGIAKNCAQARVLLKAAAERGHIEAQQKLQDMNGRGCY
jgi:hypothetical protein